MSRVVRAASIAVVLATAGLGVYEHRASIDPDVHGRYSGDVRVLQALDARLDGQVMQSRQALVAHYDGLVETQRALEKTHARLDKVPPFLDRAEAVELARLVERCRAASRDKGAVVETFKSENAVLRNSVRFFPGAAEKLRDALAAAPGGAELAALVNEVLAKVLAYNELPGSPDARAEAEGAIAALDGALHPAAFDADIEVVTNHAKAVVERAERVDAFTSNILEIPTARATLDLDAEYERAVARSINASERRRMLLFGAALCAVALVAADLILRLRRSAAQERAVGERLAEANRVLVREKERERELSELKSRFVSMTSHEFRTPLSVILSSTELLEAYSERWTPAKKSDHFVRVKNATRAMTDMLDSILVIGKSDMGKLECNPAPLDVARWAKNLADTFQPTLGTQHTLEAEIGGSFEDARADEKLLNHILTNLLSNAVKYSPKGGTVRFVARREGDDAVFVVSDQGIGIPDEDAPRLFDSFHRGKNVGHIAGTGLGLAVVKRAVDAHRGDLRYESAADRGTTFTVRIPVRADDAAA